MHSYQVLTPFFLLQLAIVIGGSLWLTGRYYHRMLTWIYVMAERREYRGRIAR